MSKESMKRAYIAGFKFAQQLMGPTVEEAFEFWYQQQIAKILEEEKPNGNGSDDK